MPTPLIRNRFLKLSPVLIVGLAVVWAAATTGTPARAAAADGGEDGGEGDGGRAVGATEGARDRPNVVLIVADDLAPTMCNFMPQGRGKSLTPNLDALAAGGVVLGNLHSPSPICTPSRFAILSGHYPSRAVNDEFAHDTRRNDGQTAVAFNTHLLPEQTNLAKRLRDAGYATGIVGKNHVIDIPGFERLPYRARLEDPGVPEQLAANAQHLRDAFHEAGFDSAEALYWGNPDADGIRQLAAHNQEWITDAARRFVADHRDGPFFLYMATTIPHGPFEDERSWQADPRITPQGMLAEVPDPQAPRSTIPDRLREAEAEGWNRANVLWLDDAVGAVVEELEAQGVKENTLLIFLSDHGTEAKGSVYRRGTQTVALMWRDGGFEAGPVVDQPLSLIDLAPTILAQTRTDYEADAFDGRDFSRVLEGRDQALHDHLYFELGYTRAVQKDGLKYLAVRYPRWARELSRDQRQQRLDKLIGELEQRDRPVPTRDPMTPYSHLTIVPGGADAEQVSIRNHPAFFDADQLYDLGRDPNEQHNLIDDPAYADRLAELRALLGQHVERLPGHFAEFDQDSATAGR